MSWFANMGWLEYSIILLILLMVSIAIGDYLENIFSWIRLQWKEASSLKKIYIGFAGVIGFALFILFCILYSQIFLVPLGLSTLELSDIDSGFALAFLGTVTGGVALFSGFLAILRSEENTRQNEIAESESEIADKQAITAEQGQITERLNKATENLGKSTDDGEPIIEVRIGALYALERIAQDSIRDHIQIMEILCAYVRHNSPLLDETENSSEITQIKTKRKKNAGEKIDEDVQTALTIIGRREQWEDGKEYIKKEKNHGYEINLFRCNLYGAKFSHANLDNAALIGSDMRETWLNYTDLSDAALGNADLTGAWFKNTILKNTTLDGAITDKAFAQICDFSKCKPLTPKQFSVMFLNKSVTIPKNRTHPQKGTDYYKDYAKFSDFMQARREWVKNIYPDIIKKNKKYLITKN